MLDRVLPCQADLFLLLWLESRLTCVPMAYLGCQLLQLPVRDR